MNSEQKEALIGEITSAFSRMEEILDSIEARRGKAYAMAADHVVEVTVTLALHEALVTKISPEIAAISEFILVKIGPGALKIGTLLAYAPQQLTSNSPEFKACVKEFSVELAPLIAERQRIQNRANSILQD